MKSNYLLILSGFLLSLVLSSSACKSDGKTTNDQNNEATTGKDEAAAPDPMFFKCWTHAFEQDSVDGTKLFLTCINHTFPVARYRQTFTLHEDGKAEYSVLDENDAHTMENGKWSYDANTKKLRINKGNDVVHEYEVLEINDDLLRVKE